MQPKTFIIFGNFRGGTSMAVHCLRTAGVFMGHAIDGGNGEDKEFQFADTRTIIELIKKRNEEFHVWGWKFPDSINLVDRFHDKLRNPHFICIFRDPFAVGLSEQKRAGQELNQMMYRTVQRNKKMIDFINEYNYPTLLLSYEHCITRREDFVSDLVKFVGMGNKSDILQAINPQYGGTSFNY